MLATKAKSWTTNSESQSTSFGKFQRSVQTEAKLEILDWLAGADQSFVLYLNIGDDAQEAEHNQHVDKTDHVPQRYHFTSGWVPAVTHTHTHIIN